MIAEPIPNTVLKELPSGHIFIIEHPVIVQSGW
jgi:hypothetical protein